jgi:hypothetical protein
MDINAARGAAVWHFVLVPSIDPGKRVVGELIYLGQFASPREKKHNQEIADIETHLLAKSDLLLKWILKLLEASPFGISFWCHRLIRGRGLWVNQFISVSLHCHEKITHPGDS